MISASEDKSIKIWDIVVDEGRLILQEKSVLVNHSEAVVDVAIATHGHFFISASEDSSIRVWSTDTAQELCRYYGDCPFTCCDLTPDGTRLIAGDSLGNVYFMKIEKP